MNTITPSTNPTNANKIMNEISDSNEIQSGHPGIKYGDKSTAIIYRVPFTFINNHTANIKTIIPTTHEPMAIVVLSIIYHPSINFHVALKPIYPAQQAMTINKHNVIKLQIKSPTVTIFDGDDGISYKIISNI